jgi:hypothetical protein
MIKYVLILWIGTSAGGGPAMHRFSSLESCEAAGNAAVATFEGDKRLGMWRSVKFVCVKE